MANKILVVEDEGLVAKNIERWLIQEGYDVIDTPPTAEEALDLVHDESPDLVLMDIQLAGEMTGIEAADVMDQQQNIPIVYLTAQTDEETIQQAESTNPFGFLSKPIDQDDLLATVRMVLRKNQEWISERRLKQKQLDEQAKLDGTLGIPNRELFLQQVREQIKATDQDRGTMFVFSVDNYHKLANVLGPHPADLILETVLERIRSLGDSETILGRIGGDKFAFFSPTLTDARRASRWADESMEPCTAPFQHEGQSYPVEASLGFTVENVENGSPENFLDHADRAATSAQNTPRIDWKLYVEKEHQNIRIEQQQTMAWDERLKEALRQQEFEAFFQPILDFKTGQFGGFEALARWRHPTDGIIPPSDFLESARNQDMMDRVEQQILEGALDMMQILHKQFPEPSFNLHINLDPGNFLSERFLEPFLKRIDTAAIDPGNVRLEIVESDRLWQNQALENLTALTDRGFLIAIDDFGTGYSSLNYLVDLPADIVKLDRSLIENLGEENPRSQVLSAAISLIQNLGKTVVAEGIETTFQEDYLKELHCDYGQGYLYAKPMDASDTRRFIKSNREDSAET